MNVLIGCECSGALRARFRVAGHNAWSCDLKIAEDDDTRHIRQDVRTMIQSADRFATTDRWDLIILHPDCKALTVAGNHVYAAGNEKHKKRLDALRWTERLWDLARRCAPYVALENPQGVLSTQSTLGKATQYIQPYQYGEDASKKTGLWLKGLPRLVPTKRVAGRKVLYKGKIVERWSNQTDSGQNRLGPSPERATNRARTYPGIAEAIVDQWGKLPVLSMREM